MTDAISHVPVDAIDESPFNPRRTYATDALEQLAETIRRDGMLQPITVRPVTGADGRWQIVFGHRRYRAAVMAGLPTVPAIVRPMSDEAAARAQLVENLQREDVHAIEEAEGFAALMREHGVSADQLVEQTGKSRSYIYGRLKLLQACAEVRDACLAGDVQPEVALLIARLRTDKLQQRALGYIRGKYLDLADGGRKSYRQVRALLREHFTLGLKDALFDPADATLLPDAGSCTDCPKRSGNAPEYSDLLRDEREGSYVAHKGNANLCTDPDCYAAKKAAHLARQAEQLQAKGKTVIAGAKARAAVGADGKLKDAYVPLKEVRELLKKAKGEKPAAVVIQDPRTGKTIEAVKREDLQAAGVKVKPAPTAAREGHAQWQQRNAKACDAETQWRRSLLTRVRAAVQATERSAYDLRLAACAAIAGVSWNDRRALLELWECESLDALESQLDTLDADALARLTIDCALVRHANVQSVYDIKVRPQWLLAAAAHYGVPLDDGASPAPTAARARKKAQRKAKANDKPAEQTPLSAPDDAGEDDAGPMRDPNTCDMFEPAGA